MYYIKNYIMGNSQSEKKKIKSEVMNNTNIQTKLKKVNDTINKTVVDVVNKTSEAMEVNSKTTMEQKTGGIRLAGIKDSSGVKVELSQVLDQSETIKISSLSEVEQSADMVNDIQKQLSTDIQKSMSAQQDSSKSEGEQAMKELMGALSGAVSDAMQALNFGGSKSSDTDMETTIKNELNISSETELINKTQNIMESSMTNETLKQMKSNLETAMTQIVDGDIEIDGVENSQDVGIALKQEAKITRDIAMDSINKTGMGSKIMAKLLEVDETVVKESVEAAQKAADEKQGTLEAAGEAAKNVGEGVAAGAKGIGEGVASGVGGVFQAMLGPIIVIGVVAIVGLFVIKPMLENLEGDDIANIVATAKGGKYMKGGSKKLVSFFKKLLSFLKPFYNKAKPFLTFKNLNIVLGLLVLYQFIKLLAKLFKKENFTDDYLNKNYYIKVDGKYIKRSDGKLELVNSKKEANLVSVIKNVDNIFLKFGAKLAITNLGKKVKVLKNAPIFYPSQKVEYNSTEQSLKIGDDFLGLLEDQLSFSGTKGKVVLEDEQGEVKIEQVAEEEPKEEPVEESKEEPEEPKME